MTAAEATRYCPRCSQDTQSEHCPADGTPTFLHALRASGATTLHPGDVIGGRYRIQGILGQGGFGAVFAAEHLMTGQAAAVKVMVGDGAALDPDLVQRFLQEARVTASLSHPNTVRIYDFGQTDAGVLFMAMEQLIGPTLDGHLKDALDRGTALSELETATIGIQILRSLTEAHAAGLVHRDLKPGNLILVQMIGEAPVVKVLDFGIARIQGSELTQAGTAIGTPAYMSPEQGRGEVPDGRADLYSLGCILFACVTGAPPYTDENPLTVLLAHQMRPVPDLRALAKVPVSDAFVAFVERALAKKVSDRFGDAMAMREALEAVVASPRPTAADPVWAPTLEADILVPGRVPPDPTLRGELSTLHSPDSATLDADVVPTSEADLPALDSVPAADPHAVATREADIVLPTPVRKTRAPQRPAPPLSDAVRPAPRRRPSPTAPRPPGPRTPKPLTSATPRRSPAEGSTTGAPTAHVLPATSVGAASIDPDAAPLGVQRSTLAQPRSSANRWLAAAVVVFGLIAVVGALWLLLRDRGIDVAPAPAAGRAVAPSGAAPESRNSAQSPVLADPAPQPDVPVATAPANESPSIAPSPAPPTPGAMPAKFEVEVAKPSAAKPARAKSTPARPTQAKPKPAKSKPVKRKPAKRKPVEPKPVKPTPGEPERAKAFDRL